MTSTERTKLIKTIENLYPADSAYPETASRGRELLDEARVNVGRTDWRMSPDAVLEEYARLCVEEDRRPATSKW